MGVVTVQKKKGRGVTFTEALRPIICTTQLHPQDRAEAGSQPETLSVLGVFSFSALLPPLPSSFVLGARL